MIVVLEPMLFEADAANRAAAEALAANAAAEQARV